METFDAVAPDGSIALDTILEAHGRLLAGTRQAEHAARIRTVQNWTGGSSSFLSGGPSKTMDFVLPSNVSCFIRLRQTGRDEFWYWSMHELQTLEAIKWAPK